ncbi:MAG: FAD-dependent oxidoreductase [Christensenellales bacterium]|nr:FAD-dependent oxidoreductase [Christensenellales bacterium]
MSNLHATVVGAGLAGSEAAWQLARQGIAVTLIDNEAGEDVPGAS